MPGLILHKQWATSPERRKEVEVTVKAGSLADLFVSKRWTSSPSLATLLAFQLAPTASSGHKVTIKPLEGDKDTCSWSGCAPFTGDAVLRIMGLRYLEEKEGYHSIANFHLHHLDGGPAAVSSVTVKRDGTVTVTVQADNLEHPDVTAKVIAAARAKSLDAFSAALPRPFRRIVVNDGLMHCQAVRHVDPCGQPMPSWYGLPTVSDIRLTSAQRIIDDLAGIGRDCLPDDVDDATVVAVGLAMHAGKWSVELLDDRELTMMLGEDCDDMVIRARSVFTALKRHLPNLRPRCELCRRIIRFIRTHSMLSCQGHASPPHETKEPGEVIGHVYGLFVDDNGTDWRTKLGLKPGVPVSMTNHQFVGALNPSLCEATAPCRAVPAAVGQVLKESPGLVSIRTAEGDASYRSLQQAQCDDGVVYFFEQGHGGQWVGGINAADVLLVPGAAPRPEKKVAALFMQADAASKSRSDAAVVFNEADPAALDELYQAYRRVLADCGVSSGDCGTSAAQAKPTTPKYRLIPRYHGRTFCSFRY